MGSWGSGASLCNPSPTVSAWEPRGLGSLVVFWGSTQWSLALDTPRVCPLYLKPPAPAPCFPSGTRCGGSSCSHSGSPNRYGCCECMAGGAGAGVVIGAGVQLEGTHLLVPWALVWPSEGAVWSMVRWPGGQVDEGRKEGMGGRWADTPLGAAALSHVSPMVCASSCRVSWGLGRTPDQH